MACYNKDSYRRIGAIGGGGLMKVWIARSVMSR